MNTHLINTLRKMARREEISGLRIVRSLDVLVDGPYVEELRDLTLEFRGSSNQRLINLDAQNESTL